MDRLFKEYRQLYDMVDNAEEEYEAGQIKQFRSTLTQLKEKLGLMMQERELSGGHNQ